MFKLKQLALLLLLLPLAVPQGAFCQETQAAPNGAVKEAADIKDLGVIARITANIFSKEQYLRQDFDDRMSSLLFNEYFKTLDPAKIYFTKKDIAGFDKFRTKLDDMIKEGDISFAFDVYSLLLKRNAEYMKFTDEILAKGLSFDTDDEFATDRTKLPWPEDDAELRKLWLLKTKNDILYYRMLSRAQKEEPPDPDKKPSAWQELPPEEKVRKRISNSFNYLKENDNIDILEIYLTSLANIYDPHSAYMSSRGVEDFNIQMSLSLVGVGATLTLDDGYTKVLSLVTGGPADLDGRLEPEDRIIAVAQGDAEPVDVIDMPLSKVVRLIRGKEKTEVRLTVLKGSKGLNSVPEVISLIRDKVKLTQQEARGELKEIELEGRKLKIGVIYLPSFYYDFEGAVHGSADFKSSTQDVRKILVGFNEKEVDGVILDVRSDGGGSLIEAINLSGLFINNGPVVQVKSSTGAVDIKYDPDKNIVYDGPLVILVNRLSASATEIFAAAMQDYGRGVVIGDKHTHGKGTVQTIISLDDFTKYYSLKTPSGSVRITTQKFYRVNGESTQLRGVVPDIIFPSFTDTMEIGEDTLSNALPWDTIAPVKFVTFMDMKKFIPDLARNSQARVAASKDFQLLNANIKIFNEMKRKTAVSLNEEKRWKTYKEEKNIFEQQQALIKMEESDESSPKKKRSASQQKDIYLDESMNILSDLLKMLAAKEAGGQPAAQ